MVTLAARAPVGQRRQVRSDGPLVANAGAPPGLTPSPAQRAVQPPSTMRVVPVTSDDAGDAR